MRNCKMKNIEKLDIMIEKIINEKAQFNPGENLILNSYDYTLRNLDSEHLVIKDIIWENDQQDLLNLLKDLEVEKVIIADSSTGLMETLSFLLNEGCVIEGPTVVNELNGNPIYGGRKRLVIKMS